MIGQYSVLFGSEMEFSVTAKTHVRVLTLSENFFSHFCHLAECGEHFIEGFIESIDRAQAYVDEFDIPICDFKIFNYMNTRHDLERR